MAITKRQIELEVRANNLSNKSMDEVIRNVNDLSDALETQAKLAEKGQGSVEDLTKTYDKLSKAGSALVSQTGVIEQMGLLAAAVDRAKERVAKTTQTLEEYKLSIAGIAKLTADQSAQLAKLEKAATAAGRSLEAQNKKFAKASDSAENIGVNMDNLAQANDRVAASSKRLNTIQTKVSDNLDNYASKIAKVVSEQADLVASELSLTKAKNARIAADDKFNADRAKTATSFREADYAKLFNGAADDAARVAKEVNAINRQYDEMIANEEALAEKQRQADREFARKRGESDAALVEKVRQAESARMFDELAAKEAEAARQADVLAKETAALEKELGKLGTTLERASKKQLDFAKASAKAANEADAAGKSSQGLLGSLGNIQKTLIGGERTSLGFFQRMRGEILSLIAAYAGFQGAIQLAQGALQSFRNEQATQTKLLVATGNDAHAAGEEYAYLRGQAERMGVAFADLSSGYASFRIASKDANVSLQDTRFIFEAITEAGVKLNLTKDNIKGVQKALEQMVSKGVASTEELGQQLGDHLPGVMQVAAKQMGFLGEDGVARFRKALENGQIDAVKAAAAIARGMNAQFAGIDMTKSLVGTEGRFQTALDDWKRAIADSGLVEAYTELLKKITEVMKSAEGRELAATIGKSFGAIAKAIIFLIDNMETLKVITLELSAAFVGIMTVRIVAWVVSLSTSVLTLASSIGLTLIPALAALGLVLGAIVLVPIGVWAYHNFEQFRKAVDGLTIGLQALYEGVALGFKTMLRTVALAIDTLTAGIRNTLATTLDLAAKAAHAVGDAGLAGELKKAASSLRNGFVGDSFIAQISKDAALAKRELASLARLAGKQDGFHAKPTEGGVINPLTGLPLVLKKKVEVTKTPETGKVGIGLIETKAKGAQEADKYASLLESLTNQVNAAMAQSLKKDKDSLTDHIAGIETQYKGLFVKLKELNAGHAATLTAQLRKAVDSLTAEATKDYWKKQVDGLDAIKKKFAEMDVQLGKNGGEEGRAKIAAGIAEQFKQIRDEIEKLDLEKLGGVARKMELLSKLDVNEKQTTTRAVNKDLFREAEDSIKNVDNLIDARDSAIQAQQNLTARGLQNQIEMYDAIGNKVAETQPQIAAMTDSTIQLLESLRGADGVDDTAIDAAILKLRDRRDAYRDIRTEIYSVADAMDDLSDVGMGTMDSLAKNIAESAMGFQSWSDGIKQVGADFAKLTADMLMDIAKIIAKEQLLALIKTGMKAVGVGVNHEGGVVGSTGRSRTVSASWFNNAPRYHTGGIAGLAPNEYPSILKKNEEVLTENDPRNVLNGGTRIGAGGSQGQAVVQDVKVMNMIDSGSFVSEGMSTPQGVKAVLNFISANRTQVKSLLG